MNTESPKINGIKNLVWDFNGTLLNDLNLCLQSINELLQIRNKKQLTAADYLKIFTFPVQDYYAQAGFNFTKEPYEKVAIEFMDLYLKDVNDCPLQENVHELLSRARRSGYRQIILSAMEATELRKLTKSLKIDGYFEHIHGIDNHMGAGKVHLAHASIKAAGFLPAETCLIGDTLHDAEVARQTGMHCILISHGHQSKERLNQSGIPVIDGLEGLVKLLHLV